MRDADRFDSREITSSERQIIVGRIAVVQAHVQCLAWKFCSTEVKRQIAVVVVFGLNSEEIIKMVLLGISSAEKELK